MHGEHSTLRLITRFVFLKITCQCCTISGTDRNSANSTIDGWADDQKKSGAGFRASMGRPSRIRGDASRGGRDGNRFQHSPTGSIGLRLRSQAPVTHQAKEEIDQVVARDRGERGSDVAWEARTGSNVEPLSTITRRTGHDRVRKPSRVAAGLRCRASHDPGGQFEPVPRRHHRARRMMVLTPS